MFDTLDTPRLSPDAARLITRLAASAGMETSGLGDAELAIRPVGRVSHAREALLVDVVTSLGDARLVVDLELADALSDELLPGWRNETPEALPLSWRLSVLISRILDNSSLRAAAPRSLDARQIEADEAEDLTLGAGPRLGFASVYHGRTHAVTLIADGPSYDAALGALGKPVATSRPVGEVLVETCALVRGPRLSLTEAARLEPGDVLLAPEATAASLPLHIRIVGGPGWSGVASYLGVFAPLHRLTPEDPIMKDFQSTEGEFAALAAQGDEAPNDEEAPNADEVSPAGAGGLALDEDELGELPVRIDLRVQSTLMPLSVFMTLDAGAVIDLQTDLNDPLDILANGRRVGSGRLVRIEDRIGVQIERWRGR